jgi:hypothetical protein
MSAQLRSLEADDTFVYVSLLTKFRLGQLVRRGNHHYKVVETKFFDRVAIVEYYKPWSHR